MKIGYARVSTGEQSLDAQIDALEDAGCERIYTDKLSGTTAERPGLADALGHLREGDQLVVWKLDRLGRSLKDLIEKIGDIEEQGAHFESLQENIDTATASGRLIFHIFGALAEFEADITRQRTMAGLRAARARGRTGGRPPALSKEDVKLAAEMMANPDYSTRAICERFDISRPTLYRYVGPDGDLREKGRELMRPE